MLSPSYTPYDVTVKLAELTLDEKISLLAGDSLWHFSSVPDKGVPRVRACDGPNGVRGLRLFNSIPASCFPCGAGISGSFDLDLLELVGQCLGEECRAKSVHMLLGPTINLQRSPLGGRNFEMFTEDPFLSGKVAAAYVKGVQSTGVSACIKHFIANEQEYERFSLDSVVSQRALRELYLEPFRVAVREAEPWAIMSAYNRINGTHVSERRDLLTDVFRGEWGWDGLVISDWSGVYSTAESIIADCDVEMPGPTVMRGQAVHRQLIAKKITEKDIDTAVERVLKFGNKAIASGIPFEGPEGSADGPKVRAAMRRAAQASVVLLKNECELLPLDAHSGKKIAIIGSSAKFASPSGGGSAYLDCSYTTSPLDAIIPVAAENGMEVEYSIGSTVFKCLPFLDPYCEDLRVDVYVNDPTKDWLTDIETPLTSIKPDFTVGTASTYAYITDLIPWDELGPHPMFRMTGSFTPDQSGTWDMGLGSVGRANVYLDGKLVVENNRNWNAGELFFNEGSTEQRTQVGLVKGRKYSLELRHWFLPSQVVGGPFGSKHGIQLGGFPYESEESMLRNAEKVAAGADLSLVFVGTTFEWEAEGYDRQSLKIPGTQDELVRRILAACPNTIVVTNSGSAIEMPWVDEASTIVHTFFGGNEAGNALADVLFGKVDPHGRLSITFPRRLEDNPSFHSFAPTIEAPDKVHYTEGVFMGYPWYHKRSIEPLFPFGHGLSYTSFAISNFAVSQPTGVKLEVEVEFTVKNTGSRAGAFIGQIYVSPHDPSAIPIRPLRKLAGFAKRHLGPGEAQAVTVTLGKESWSSWFEEQACWIARKGKYAVSVRHNSGAKVEAESDVSVQEDLKWIGL